MLGLNEYYDSLLLEAKSPEEIKKILTYKYVTGRGVPQEVLDGILNIDPTKRKTYTSWVLNLWENEKDLITEMLNNGTLENIFKYFTERNNTGLNLTAMKSLKQAYNMLPNIDPVLTKTGSGGPEDNYDIIYDSAEWKIAEPHSYEASQKLGQGCRWCTAGAFGNGRHYYNTYSMYGPLFINFDMRKPEIAPMDEKEYPYTRYQFLFEYRNWYGEHMDSDDKRISFSDIDMPEEVVNFYGEQEYRYKWIIENGGADDDSVWNDYHAERQANGIILKNENYGHTLELLEPLNRERPVVGEFDYFYLYDGADLSDSILDGVKFKNDCVVETMENMPCILLKDIDGKQWLCYLEEDSYWDVVLLNPETSFISQEGNGLVCFWYKSGDFNTYFKYYNGQTNDEFFLSKTFRDNIKQVIYKSLERDGFQTYGFTFEIIFDTGFHSLLCFNSYGCDEIISYDKPIDKYKFTVSQDEEGYDYIQGLYGVHYFDLPSTKNVQNLAYDFSKEIDDNLYIVYSTVGDGGYNIYDRTKKRLLFDEWYSNIENVRWKENLFILHNPDVYGDGRILFNSETNNIKRFDYISNFETKDYLIGSNKAKHTPTVDQEESATLLDKFGNEIVSFKNIFTLLNHNKLIVKLENNLLNFYDFVTKKFSLDEGVEYVFSLNGGNIQGAIVSTTYTVNHFIVGKRGDNMLYNYVTNKLICRVTNLPSDITNYFHVGKDRIFKITDSSQPNTGLYNILVDDELLLPENVNEIWTAHHCKGYVPFVKDNILQFVNVDSGKILPKGGFDVRFINTRYIIHTNDFDGLVMTAIEPKEFGLDGVQRNFNEIGKFAYYPATNNIECVQPEVKEFVTKRILRDAGQISENFKRMFDRINNVKF